MIEKVYQYLRKGVYSGSHAFTWVGMISMVFLVLVLSFDAIMRRIFNMPVKGSGELAQLGLSVVVFSSFAYCGVIGAHVYVDIVISRLKSGVRKIIRVFTQFFSVATLGILAWQLFTYTGKMKESGQSSVMLGIPIYPFVLVSAIGTTMLALVFIILLVGTLVEVKKR